MQRKFTLLTFLLLSTFLSFGQKIKIKKNQIFVDDVHRGFVFKDRGLKSKLFFLDFNKDTLFVVGQQSVPSPIDPSTNSYNYDFLYVPKMKSTVYKPFKEKYFFTDDRVLEYYLSQNVLNSDLTLNSERMTSFLATTEPAPPARLTKILQDEGESLAKEDYIAPRLVKDNATENANIITEIVQVSSEQHGLEFDPQPAARYAYVTYHYRQRYSNSKSQEEEIVVLAKVVTKSKDLFFSKEPMLEISVYNSLGKLVGHLGSGTFGDLLIYSGNIKKSNIEHNLNDQMNQQLRAKKLVEYLIKMKKL